MKRPLPSGWTRGQEIEKPVGIDPEIPHQFDVLGHAVVVVAGHGGGMVLQDVAGLLGEGVPAGGAAAAVIKAPSIWKAAEETPRVNPGLRRAARA